MITVTLEINVAVHDDYTSFSAQEKTLFAAAKAACDDAYAPYSNFHVGAAVLLENDEIFKGNNQENAAYPSGLCAERVALFYASAVRPNIAIKALAITVDYSNTDFDEIVSPCGGCRQAIAEYEHKFKQNITIYVLGRNDKVFVIKSMKDLLPFLFSGDILKAFNK